MREQYDENLLIGYVEDDLPADDRATVQRWLDADPGLRRLVEGMIGDRAALRGLPEPEPPAGLADDVDAGLEREMLLGGGFDNATSVVVEKRGVLRRISAVSAMAAALLLGAFVIGRSLIELHPHLSAPDEEVADAGAPPDDLLPGPSKTGRSAENDRFAKGTDRRTATEPVDQLAVDNAPADPAALPVAPAGAPVEKRGLAEVGLGSGEADEGGALPGKAADTNVLHANAAVAETATQRPAVVDAPADDAVVAMDIADSARALRLERSAPAEEVADELVVLRVNTRDLSRSVEQLNQVVSNIERARVRLTGVAAAPQAGLVPVAPPSASPAPMPAAGAADESDAAEARADSQAANAPQPLADVTGDAVQSKAGPRATSQAIAQAGAPVQAERQRGRHVAYELSVPRDQVDRAIDMLRNARDAGYQQVQVNRVAGGGGVPARNSQNWPSYQPDYGSILREQLPLAEAKLDDARRQVADDAQVIRVVIEEQVDGVPAEAETQVLLRQTDTPGPPDTPDAPDTPDTSPDGESEPAP